MIIAAENYNDILPFKVKRIPSSLKVTLDNGLNFLDPMRTCIAGMDIDPEPLLLLFMLLWVLTVPLVALLEDPIKKVIGALIN